MEVTYQSNVELRVVVARTDIHQYQKNMIGELMVHIQTIIGPTTVRMKIQMNSPMRTTTGSKVFNGVWTHKTDGKELLVSRRSR